jgi:uncharacterized protein YyaL (SSP411 family)
MPNRLLDAPSPYLQQHSQNPVDWYPWSSQALERARKEDRPIFLSIGYSSCHWCHVMERESFSDSKVADFLNQHFVSIKVDREERPDLDHLYMTAVQAMSGSGGWPLNVFLTPDLKPFFGGTYFPPDHRYNRLPFLEILRRVIDVYRSQPDEVRRNADQLMALMIQNSRYFEGRKDLDRSLPQRVFENVMRTLDEKHGGVGHAPKFFHTDALRLMLRVGVDQKDQGLISQVVDSLHKIAKGGVYDQMGGGFHRYSTDAEWKIPHFEKMLYDNALLLRLYTEVWQVSRDSYCAEIVGEIADWVAREMTDAGGGFYSAIDADSEHEEGKFYLWGFDELQSLVSQDLWPQMIDEFKLSRAGHYEGRNVFHFDRIPDAVVRSRLKQELKRLRAVRDQREWPLIDRKVLVSWNALMITALCRAGSVFEKPEWIQMAERAADFVLEKMSQGKTLYHCRFEDHRSQESFLEDHAYFCEALLDLFEVTGREKYLASAQSFAHGMNEKFLDERDGGFWSSSVDQRDLLMRSKEIFDGATPSPYHVALSVLFRLTHWTGDAAWAQIGEKAARAILGNALEAPGGFQRLALVLDDWMNGSKIVIAVNPTEHERKKLKQSFLPRVSVIELFAPVESVPALSGKYAEGQSRFWVCELGQCSVPSARLSDLQNIPIDEL